MSAANLSDLLAIPIVPSDSLGKHQIWFFTHYTFLLGLVHQDFEVFGFGVVVCAFAARISAILCQSLTQREAGLRDQMAKAMLYQRSGKYSRLEHVQRRLVGFQLFGHEITWSVVFFFVNGVDVVGHQLFELEQSQQDLTRQLLSS